MIQCGKPRRPTDLINHHILSSFSLPSPPLHFTSLHPLSTHLTIYLPSSIPHPSEKTSSDNHLLVIREIIRGHRQIQRRGALPRAARDVVVRAVAGAEPAAEVAGFAYGDAAEVRAYACFL